MILYHILQEANRKGRGAHAEQNDRACRAFEQRSIPKRDSSSYKSCGSESERIRNFLLDPNPNPTNVVSRSELPPLISAAELNLKEYETFCWIRIRV
jgi:hypothetical protein